MSHITTANQAVAHKGGVEDLREKIKGLSKAGIEVGNKKHFNKQEVNHKKHFNKQAEAVAAAMKAAVREDINRKKRFLSGSARIRGGGLPMPRFFGPFFLPSISP